MQYAAASPSARAPFLDALRLLTLVHQLGERPPEGAAEGSGEDGAAVLRGERQLLALDHLLRHPETLGLLLVDAFERLPELAEKRAGLTRRLRWLFGAESSPPAPAFRRARSRAQTAERRLVFASFAAPWRRCDDALAELTCRALLEVGVDAGQPPVLAYRLAPRGAELLEQRFYPGVKIAGAYLKQCAAIREYLPDWRRLDFEQRLGAVTDRLESLRAEEHVPREIDVIPTLFESVFSERL